MEQHSCTNGIVLLWSTSASLPWKSWCSVGNSTSVQTVDLHREELLLVCTSTSDALSLHSLSRRSSEWPHSGVQSRPLGSTPTHVIGLQWIDAVAVVLRSDNLLTWKLCVFESGGRGRKRSMEVREAAGERISAMTLWDPSVQDDRGRHPRIDLHVLLDSIGVIEFDKGCHCLRLFVSETSSLTLQIMHLAVFERSQLGAGNLTALVQISPAVVTKPCDFCCPLSPFM